MAKDFASLLNIPLEEVNFFVSGMSNFLDFLDLTEGVSYLREGNYDKAFENFSKVGVSQVINLLPYVSTMLTVVSFAQPFWDRVIVYVFDEKINQFKQEFVNRKMDELRKPLEKNPLAFKGEDFKKWLESDSVEVSDFLELVFEDGGMKHGLYNVGNKILNEKEFESKKWYEKMKSLFLNLSHKAYTTEEVKNLWITQWRAEAFKRGIDYVVEKKREALSYFLSASSVSVTVEINAPGEFVLSVPELDLNVRMQKKYTVSSSLKDLKSRQITITLKDLKGNIVYTKTLEEKELFEKYDPLLSTEKSTYYVKKISVTPAYEREIVENLHVELPEKTKSATVTVAGKDDVRTYKVENTRSVLLPDVNVTLDEEIEIEAEISDAATEARKLYERAYVPSTGEIVVCVAETPKLDFQNQEEYNAYLQNIREQFLENINDPNSVKVLLYKLEKAFYAFHVNPLDRAAFNVVSYCREKFIGYKYRLNEEENLFKSINNKFSLLSNQIYESDKKWGDLNYDVRNLEYISSRLFDGAVIPAYYSYIVQAKEDIQRKIYGKKSDLERILSELSNVLEQTEEFKKTVEGKIALDVLFETNLIQQSSQLVRQVQEKINKVMASLSELESLKIRSDTCIDNFVCLMNYTHEQAEFYNTLVDQWHLLMEQARVLEKDIQNFKPEYVNYLSELMKYGGINFFYLKENEQLKGIGLNEIAARAFQEFLEEEELTDRVQRFNKTAENLRRQIEQYHRYHYYVSLNENDLNVDKSYRLEGNYGYRYSVSFFDKSFPHKSIGFSRELGSVPELLEKFSMLSEKLKQQDPQGDRVREKLEKLLSLSSFETVEEYNAIVDEWIKLYKAYEQEDFYKINALSYSYIDRDGRTVQKTYPTDDFLKWLSQRNSKNQNFILDKYLRKITDDPKREGYETRDPLSVLGRNLIEAVKRALADYESRMMVQIDSLKNLSKMTRKRKEQEIQKMIMTDPFTAVDAKVPEEIKDWTFRISKFELSEDWNRITSELQAHLEEVMKQ